MGYLGGWFDSVVSRIVEAILALPFAIIILLFAVAIGPSVGSITVIIGLVFTPLIARTVRTAVLVERHQDYVSASRLLGESPARVMSLVDYGHRGVPNVFLTSPLETYNAKTGTGTWNAAHFANAQYDKLVAQYIAASDLGTQKTLAGQIETLLLAQTPIIFGYFYNYLTATTKGVTGVYPTAVGHLFLYDAAKS